MREILFRGQTRRYGEKVRMGDGQPLPSRWVYGGVLQGVGAHSIIYGGENVDDPSEGLNKWAVYTDTLGQFTGLTDKNGKKIFEGDILKVTWNAPGRKPTVACFVVEFRSGTFLTRQTNTNKIAGTVANYALTRNVGDTGVFCEIIGNIHDNPELLGGERNSNG